MTGDNLRSGRRQSQKAPPPAYTQFLELRRLKMNAIWVHEICGNSPVHPKSHICMKCQTPVFLEECNKWQVTDEWVADHPAAKDYLVDKETQ